MNVRRSAVAAIDDKATPVEDRIRQRAYEIYLSRGDQPGSPEDDWYSAQEEIRQQAEANRTLVRY